MAKQEFKVPFVIDLQRFSDTQPLQEGQQPQAQPVQADLNAQALAILRGGNTPTEGAAPQQGQPQPTDGNTPQNSPQEGGQQPGQQPNQEPTQGQPGQQQAPNSVDQMLLGKFRSPEDLANGYVNVERAYSQKAQEAATLQQQNAALQQQMQQMQQQIQSVVNPQQQQPQPSQEEMVEQFMNGFYDNPIQQIDQRIEQAIQKLVAPQIAPIQQQFQQQQVAQARNQATRQFAEATPDFQQFQPIMAEILSSNDALNQMDPSQAIQIAYKMAKGEQDPRTLLQNQDFVNQNILGNQDFVTQHIINNPEIEKQIIERYLQGVKQNNQAPTVINGQINGATPVVPQNQPTTIKDAHNIALEYMKR